MKEYQFNFPDYGLCHDFGTQLHPRFLFTFTSIYLFGMRILFTFFLIFYSLPGYALQPETHLSDNAGFTLVAKNNKHTRRYKNGEILKIFYHDGSKILKARGKLLIINQNEILMVPFHKRDIITINVNDIESIGLWKRNYKTSSIIIGGTGLMAIGLAASINQPQGSGLGGADFVGFTLMIYSITVLWYEVIAIPAIFLIEHVGIRSAKKGYHFFIESR